MGDQRHSTPPPTQHGSTLTQHEIHLRGAHCSSSHTTATTAAPPAVGTRQSYGAPPPCRSQLARAKYLLRPGVTRGSLGAAQLAPLLVAHVYRHAVGVGFDPAGAGRLLSALLRRHLRPARDASWHETGGGAVAVAGALTGIAVNGELEALEVVLAASLEILKPGGRLVVLSYHSLEDRIVKRFVAAERRGCTCPPVFPVCVCGRAPRLRSVGPQPAVPTDSEIAANPRARSARLRTAERLAA
jgi:hypothetical protein